jgi:DNA replication and repair protein RecF
MNLQTLILHDFRNYVEQTFTFDRNIVVFVGQNGRGKTNVLEAISVLSVGKSWRETVSTDLIRNGADSAQIQAKLQSGDSFKIQIQPRSRTFARNEKKITRKKFFGQIPTLLFAPEHLSLFSGAKRERQKFFDRVLAQISPVYRENLARADKATRQKNALLRSFEETEPGLGSSFSASGARALEISPWNEILAEVIPQIWRERTEFLKSISGEFQHQLNEISQSKEQVSIRLQTPEVYEPTTEGVRDFFRHNFARECAARKSFLGPHRDDFVFTLRNRPLNATASRGEERSVLLALLVAQKKVLADQFGAAPILLLDDCFSELDSARQSALQKLCQDSQVFFTTTHGEHFAAFDASEVQVFEI